MAAVLMDVVLLLAGIIAYYYSVFCQ